MFMSQNPQISQLRSLAAHPAYRAPEAIEDVPPLSTTIELKPDQLEFLDFTLSSNPGGYPADVALATPMSAKRIEDES